MAIWIMHLKMTNIQNGFKHSWPMTYEVIKGHNISPILTKIILVIFQSKLENDMLSDVFKSYNKAVNLINSHGALFLQLLYKTIQKHKMILSTTACKF